MTQKRRKKFSDLPLWVRYLTVAALAGGCTIMFGGIGLILFLVLLGIYLISREGLYS